MTIAVEPFEMHIEIRPEDIDRFGHVNNLVYLKWVIKAAVEHWKTIAPPADQEKLIWVVRRHEIDYKKQAYKRDAIIARTWIGKASRLMFDRHTEILRASDRKILAVAKTVWCPLDIKTGRPADISPETRALFSTP